MRGAAAIARRKLGRGVLRGPSLAQKDKAPTQKTSNMRSPWQAVEITGRRVFCRSGNDPRSTKCGSSGQTVAAWAFLSSVPLPFNSGLALPPQAGALNKTDYWQNRGETPKTS